MILSSFKYAGVSSEFDGSEDDQFRGYEDLIKESKTKELVYE